ncbi:MAG: nuclear transport factor 2 family protein [Acidimicrobiales bacterium]|nr:nuclear transport factor 2 family protein [Acidimicrobiales bacterium]
MALSADDVAAIQNLASAYCHHIDRGDGESYADLFTPDGVFEIVDLTTATGREELSANAVMFPQVLEGGRHVVNNVFVEGDGDAASMQCYLTFVMTGDQPAIHQTGRYQDEVVRVDGEWKFARRTLTLDGALM